MNATRMSQYKETLLTSVGETPTFGSICNTSIEKFKKSGKRINFVYNGIYNALDKGKAILQTERQTDMYMICYAEMHIYKLNESFHELLKDKGLEGKLVDVIDWGCGQGVASCTLVDYLSYNSMNVGINSFTLIEPSEIALELANVHIQAIYQNSKTPSITNIQRRIEDISENDIQIKSENVKVHLFSNILDVIEPKYFAKIQQLIAENQSGIHYFVCIGCGSKLDWKSKFSCLFEEKTILSERNDSFKRLVFNPKTLGKSPYNITRVELIFKTII